MPGANAITVVAMNICFKENWNRRRVPVGVDSEGTGGKSMIVNAVFVSRVFRCYVRIAVFLPTTHFSGSLRLKVGRCPSFQRNPFCIWALLA